EVAVGDPEAFNSQHVVRAEGKVLIDNFIPTPLATLSIGQDTVTITDGRLTLDDIGAPSTGNTKIIYLDIFPIDSSAFPPVVTTELFGNQEPDGDYLEMVEVSLFAQDHSGSNTIATLEYSFDGVSYTPYVGPFLVTIDGGVAQEDYNLQVRAVDGFGNEGSTTRSFRLVSPSGALIRLENMAKVPGTDRSLPADDFYSFNSIGIPKTLRADTALAFDKNIVRIHNEGTGTLLITELTTTDTNSFVVRDFDIPPTGLAVAPGAFVDALVIFKNVGGDRRIITEQLVLETNADNALDVGATLKGGFAFRTEGGNELTNQIIFEVTGLGTKMGQLSNGTFIVYPSSDYPTDEDVDNGVHGDLILSGIFEKADPNQPVRMFQLAAMHGPNSPTSRIVRANGGGNLISFRHEADYFQSIFPYRTSAAVDIAGGSTNSSDPFYISIANYRSTGGNSRGQFANDILGVRVYRAVDREGNTIPNEYIAIQDYIGNGCDQGSGNCDWNDNVVYLINARPVNQPTVSQISDFSVDVLTQESYAIAPFFDKGYPGNRLLYTATLAGGAPIPDWMSMDETTGDLSILAPFAEADTDWQVTVTGTDYNLVAVSSTFTLSVDPTTITCSVNANTDGLPKEVSCNNPTVQLLGSVDEGNPVWTGPGNFSSSLSNPVVSQAGIYTLTSDDPDCPLTSTVEVTMGPDFPGGTISGPTTILTCTVGFIELTANAVDPAATFAWYDGADQLIGTGTSLLVTQPDTYRLEATNASGCVSFATAQIDEDLTPASAGMDGNLILCGSDDPVSLYAALLGFGGNPEDDGAWWFDGTPVPDQLDPSTATEGTYRYVVGGERGCVFDTALLQLTITVPDIYYEDVDRDGLGDPNSFIYACVLPTDYVTNDDDNCPFVNSLDLTDADSDGQGDVCDNDDDNDGVLDFDDCDPFNPTIGLPTFYYADFDEDGFGDPNNGFATCALPPNGYILDNTDNCPNTTNPSQNDTDGDGIGDVCDPSSTGATVFWLEAECAQVGDNWEVETDTLASGGGYVVTDENKTNGAPDDIPDNYIRFIVDGVQPEEYFVYARIKAISTTDNSFYVRVNGGEWVAWFQDIEVGDYYAWNRMIGVPFFLSDGINTIDFAYRENGTYLDKIYVGLDDTAPEGFGDEASNCDSGMNEAPVAVAFG
ncbi:MAG: putative Ig domain-containing protein, partial [Bacteroidota bacterium]